MEEKDTETKRLSYEDALTAIRWGVAIDDIGISEGSSAEQLAQCYANSPSKEWTQHIEELWTAHTFLSKTLQQNMFTDMSKKPIIALDAKASLLSNYHEALRVIKWLVGNGDIAIPKETIEQIALLYAASFKEEREWLLEQMGVENESDL